MMNENAGEKIGNIIVICQVCGRIELLNVLEKPRAPWHFTTLAELFPEKISMPWDIWVCPDCSKNAASENGADLDREKLRDLLLNRKARVVDARAVMSALNCIDQESKFMDDVDTRVQQLLMAIRRDDPEYVTIISGK